MSKDLVIKLMLPEDLYNKLSLEAQKRTLPLSTHLRLLLIEHVGGTGWNDPPTVEAPTQAKVGAGRPPKIRPYLEKYENLGVYDKITHPRDPVLISMFEPVEGAGERQELNLYTIALRWLKGDAGFDGTLLQRTWGTFMKNDINDYPDWRDDPSGALCRFANILYRHANPE